MKSYDIAFLLGYPEISGGTNVIMEHALGLTKLGHKVSIVTQAKFDPQRLSWKPEAMKLPLLSHAECRERVFDATIATWWRSTYDIPFVHARRYAYFVQSIESRFFPPEQPDMKALAEYSYRMPLSVVTEATWIQRYLEGHYGRKASLVLNGIDKVNFSTEGAIEAARPTDGIRVLVEGPLGVEFKRTDLAIDLCRQAGMNDVWLLTSSECSEFAGASRVFSKVPISRVGDIYRSCDVLVKLSTVEGMFGPPLEIFHCGGTAITSDVTGHDEYMVHGKNGLVVRRGHESEVVDHLRRLQSDRALLNSLKEGAVATAKRWPDWPASTKAFEAYLENLIESPGIDKQATEAMLVSLRGALRLAGPLHSLLRREMSGKEALRRVQQKAKEKLANRLPVLRPLLAPQTIEMKPAARPPVVRLPDKVHSAVLVRKQTYRTAFLLPAHGFRWHVPSTNDRLQPLLLPLEGPPSRREFQTLAAFKPDVTFVLNPEQLARRDIEALPGLVVGHTSAPTSTSELEHLSELFPSHDRRCGVLHLDQREVGVLASRSIRVLGSLLLPIDEAQYRSVDTFEQWRKRPIPLAYIGRAHRSTSATLGDMANIPGFTRIDPELDDSTLRGILAQTQCVLHLHDPQQPLPTASLAIRDMAMGCLVIAHRFRVDYSLMAGEHYIYYKDLAEATNVAAVTTDIQDHQDVVRSVGRARAFEFAASAVFLDFIERHLCLPQPGFAEAAL